MKKLIATLLALAMLLSGVSALAGSAGSQSGMTTRSAELAAFEDGNGFIYISGLGSAVNTTPAAKVVSIDPYRILFLAQENAAAGIPATRLIALSLDDNLESIVTDDALCADIIGDGVYYISASDPRTVYCHDLTAQTSVAVFQAAEAIERVYATSEGIVAVISGGETAYLIGETGYQAYTREIAQEYAVYDSFDLYTTAERGLCAVYDGETIAVDVNVTAWAVLNDQIYYLTDNTGMLSLKCYDPAAALWSVVVPACQNMQYQLTASQSLLFMISNGNVVHTVDTATGALKQYVGLPATDSYTLPGNATLEGYCIEAVSGQLNILGKVKQAAAAPTFTFVQSAQQAVVESATDYMLLTAYAISGEDTVHMLLQPAVQYSLLQYGSRGDAVSAIQQALLDLKYYDYIVDGIYGWRTQEAIKVLQADLGLEVTGAADAALQKLILGGTLSAYDPYRALAKGDTGLRVQNMQQRLRDLGYLADSADGIFGGRTEAAVMLFQREHGLKQTGIADAATLKLLYSDAATACSVYIELTRGDSGYRVRELNQRLKDLYYLDVKVSSNYNSSTVTAVKKFQAVAGLKQTGVATPEVQKALFAKNAPENPDLITLRRGDDNARVLKMQKRLTDLGYNCGKPDGEYGKNTEKAVKLFQRMAGLEDTGIATVETQQRLYAPDAPIYVEPTEISAPIISIDGASLVDGDVHLLDLGFQNILISWYVDGEASSYDVRLTDAGGVTLIDEKSVISDMLSLPVDTFVAGETYTIAVTAHPASTHTGGAKTAQLRFMRPRVQTLDPIGITSLVIMPEGSFEIIDDVIVFQQDSTLLWSAAGAVYGYTWQVTDDGGNALPGYGSFTLSGDDRVLLCADNFNADALYRLTVLAYASENDPAPVSASVCFRFEGQQTAFAPIDLNEPTPTAIPELPAEQVEQAEPIQTAIPTKIPEQVTPIPTSIPTEAPVEPVNVISDLIIFPGNDYPLIDSVYELTGDSLFAWGVNGIPHAYAFTIADADGNPVPDYDSKQMSLEESVYLPAGDFTPGTVYTLYVAAFAGENDPQPLNASIDFRFAEVESIPEWESTEPEFTVEELPVEDDAPVVDEFAGVEEFIPEDLPVEEPAPGLIRLMGMPYNDIEDELQNVSWFENPDSGVWTAEGYCETKSGEAVVYFDFYEQPGSGVYPGSMTVVDFGGAKAPVTDTLFTGMSYDDVRGLPWEDLSKPEDDGMGGSYATGYWEQGCYMDLLFDQNGLLYSVTITFFE